ncbi:MAG: hypothetical protein AB1489_30795 [Acidobacteriota bacterium]
MLTPEVIAILDKVKRPANKIIVEPTHQEVDVSANPFGSWFGHIGAMNANEQWPHWRSTPMVPLCQINTAELPVMPQTISDIALICVWIGKRNSWRRGSPSGMGWQIRCYSSLNGLIPIKDTFRKLLNKSWTGKLLHLIQRTSIPDPTPIKWQLVDDYPSGAHLLIL